MASNVKAKVCPMCGKDIKENTATTICPQCGVVHHMQCWEKNNGCYTNGCIAGGKHGRDIKEIAHMQHSAYRKDLSKKKVSVQDRRIQSGGTYNNDNIGSHNVSPKNAKKAPAKPKSGDKLTPPLPPTPPVTPTPHEDKKPQQPNKTNKSRSKYTGYLSNGRIDEFMQALIQNNIYYYDQKFSMMNASGKSISWNWASFFFGAYWMMYRKMYLNTLFLVLISWAIAFIYFIPIVGWFIGGLMTIGLWVCLGMFGNAIYKKHLEKKYTECIELEYDQRKQECVATGGTSAGAVVIYVVISMLLSGILLSVLTILGFLSAFGTFGVLSSLV